jgi:exodeoxyribonuclease VIII
MSLIPSTEAEGFMEEFKNHDPNKDGILEWDDDTYFADTKYVTNTHLKKINEGGPQHLKAYHELGGKTSKAFTFGSAVHCIVLEPDMFEARFYAVDDSEICEEIGGKRPTTTKAYKEWIGEILINNANRERLTMEEMDRVFAIRDKLTSIPNVVQLLSQTKNEIVYQNTLLGVKCKSKLDATKVGKYVVDLKTMADAVTEQSFLKAMRKYSYDQQGAFYKDVANIDKFYFIAVEKTYPFTVGIFELGEDSYISGKEKYEYALEQFKYHFVENESEIDNHFIQGII